jgi:hypothetical protein
MRPNNLSRHLKTFVAIGTLLFGGSAYANNWYVRPAASGSANGSDWNNAWAMSNVNSNQSSIQPGDTVWIAAGSHNANLTFTKSGTAGNPIKYYGVLATDPVPTAAAGYSSAFAVTTANNIHFPNNTTLDFESNYVTIDGRVIDGFYWQFTAGGDGCRLSQSGNGNNHINMLHCSLIGPYSVHGAPAGYGISWWAGGGNFGRSDILISYCTVRGWCEDFKFSNALRITIDHCLVGDTYNDSIDHEDTCYSYASNNVIWRYNKFYNSPNDGFFNEDTSGTVCQNWYFYGNVFYNYINWIICTKSDSVACGPLFIYNNVFHAPIGEAVGLVSTNGMTPSGGTTYLYNNIFINVQNSMSGMGNVISDYNAYDSGSTGIPSGDGSHSFTFSYNANQFTHIAPPPSGGVTESPNVGDPSGDYHLTASGAAVFQKRGVAITPANGFLNADVDGNVRGANGGWDVGAYQYQSGQPAPTPQPPLNLRITGS